MARSNNNMFLYIVIGILVIFGIYYSCNQSRTAPPQPGSGGGSPAGRVNHPSPVKKQDPGSNPDIEFIPPSDDPQNGQGHDDFHLIGVADEQPAFELGFGMGPGLYGSARAVSSMVGN